MDKIAIIKLGIGNPGSVQTMLRRIGRNSFLTDNPSEIEKATKIILPGVGSFDSGMEALEEKKLLDVLALKVLIQKVPILGVCLGAQLLGIDSEEGIKKGLGWIKMHSKKFSNEKKIIPNMGWNYLVPTYQTDLTRDISEPLRFYFAHSFHFADIEHNTLIDSAFSDYRFPAIVQKKNIFAVQFHPEKSHRYGLKILSNFACI